MEEKLTYPPLTIDRKPPKTEVTSPGEEPTGKFLSDSTNAQLDKSPQELGVPVWKERRKPEDEAFVPRYREKSIRQVLEKMPAALVIEDLAKFIAEHGTGAFDSRKAARMVYDAVAARGQTSRLRARVDNFEEIALEEMEKALTQLESESENQ